MNNFLNNISNFSYPIHVKKISLNYRILILVIAAVYAVYLANLPIYAFKDRINYINYTFNSEYIFYDRLSNNWISLLSNEPLFLLINIFLSKYFSSENTLRILIGIPAFITAYSILRVNPRYFILLLFILLVPQIVKNHIIHLRQGIAISFFLIGWFSNKKYIKYLFLLLTPFIHSSFFMILSIVFVNDFFKNYQFFKKSRTLFYLFFAMLISLSMGFISSILDARQQGYEFEAGDISGLGFLFWFLILILFLFENREFKRKAAVPLGFLILYLVCYFTVEVAARVFESGIILVVLSGLYLSKKRKLMFFLILFLYTLYSYYVRYSLPYWGWGIT